MQRQGVNDDAAASPHAAPSRALSASSQLYGDALHSILAFVRLREFHLAARVCRSWRAATLSCPVRTEARLAFSKPGEMERLLRYFSSSFACRLVGSLSVGCTGQWASLDQINLISDRLGHLRSLSLHVAVRPGLAYAFLGVTLPPSLVSAEFTFAFRYNDARHYGHVFINIGEIWMQVNDVLKGLGRPAAEGGNGAGGERHSLRSLRVHFEGEDWTPPLETLSSSFDLIRATCPSLTALQWDSNHAAQARAPPREAWTPAIWDALRSMERLTEVALKHGELDPAELASISANPAPGWTALDLAKVQVNSSTAPSIARMTGLKSLHPSSMRLPDPRELFSSLSTSLTSVRLLCGKAVDPGFLAEGLGACRGLQTLHLRSSRVNGDQLRFALETMVCLESLVLHDLPRLASLEFLTPASLPALASSLRTLELVELTRLPTGDAKFLLSLRRLTSLKVWDSFEFRLTAEELASFTRDAAASFPYLDPRHFVYDADNRPVDGGVLALQPPPARPQVHNGAGEEEWRR